jgi:hypothetical protein
LQGVEKSNQRDCKPQPATKRDQALVKQMIGRAFRTIVVNRGFDPVKVKLGEDLARHSRAFDLHVGVVNRHQETIAREQVGRELALGGMQRGRGDRRIAGGRNDPVRDSARVQPPHKRLRRGH